MKLIQTNIVGPDRLDTQEGTGLGHYPFDPIGTIHFSLSEHRLFSEVKS